MKKWLFIFVVLACCAGKLAAQSADGEFDLKAVFIYNFTRYIEWDTTKMQDEFVIGVMGSSPISNALSEIAARRLVRNKRITIRVCNRVEDIRGCQVLFIPKQTSLPLSTILLSTPKGTLTVSESPGSAMEGTAFNFILLNNKLKFEANLRALTNAGLKAGSQLLKLAIIVQ